MIRHVVEDSRPADTNLRRRRRTDGRPAISIAHQKSSIFATDAKNRAAVAAEKPRSLSGQRSCPQGIIQLNSRRIRCEIVCVYVSFRLARGTIVIRFRCCHIRAFTNNQTITAGRKGGRIAGADDNSCFRAGKSGNPVHLARLEVAHKNVCAIDLFVYLHAVNARLGRSLRAAIVPGRKKRHGRSRLLSVLAGRIRLPGDGLAAGVVSVLASGKIVFGDMPIGVDIEIILGAVLYPAFMPTRCRIAITENPARIAVVRTDQKAKGDVKNGSIVVCPEKTCRF